MRSCVLVFLCVLAIFSLGCKEVKQEASDILHEDAVVVETVYTPSRHGSGSSFGPSMNMDGDIGFSFHSVSINVPELYAVVFKCQHGKFVIEGDDQRHKNLWERFSENDEVDVSYREIYRNIYKKVDGRKELIESVLIDYDFLDAVIK